LNFVGKILGQGGENVKRLQETTGVRIAVLGAGSMKDKKKVENLFNRQAHAINVFLVLRDST
jgi:KH domain